MKHFVLIGLCLVLISSCKKDPPLVPEPTLSLAAVDASCIEAWLRVTTADIPATVRLLRDGQPVSVLGLRSPDSLLIDEGLLPNHTYTYQLHKLAGDSTVIETSASVQVTTMDTTSSNWSFAIDTLGVTASVLYDVAIISDTNIWAVGELFLRDSSGNLDPILYNAARWNGTRWDIIRIPYIYQGQTLYGALRAVFAFDANDVWLGSGNMIHWNGQSFTSVELPAGVWGPYRINKIWGHDGEIWIVGDGGSIAHRSADGTWRQLESGTGLPIMDVYGGQDSRTGLNEILCVAEAYGIPGGSRILSIENTSVREKTTNGLASWGIEGIWFIPKRQYMVIGQGVWRARSTEGHWLLDDTLPRLATTSISGHGLNDIVVCGAFQLLAHWNGVHWQTFFPRTASSGFVAVDMQSDLLVAVGGVGNRALALRGRRRP